MKTRHRYELNPFFEKNEKQGTYVNRDKAPKSSLDVFSSSWPNPATGSPKEKLIKALKAEIAVLDFSHSPLSEVPEERAASLYFRSNIKRRLIGAFVLLKPFEEKWVTQKDLIEQFKLSKGFVCQVFSDAVEAGWFIKKVQPRFNMAKGPLYQCGEAMTGAAKNIWPS